MSLGYKCVLAVLSLRLLGRKRLLTIADVKKISWARKDLKIGFSVGTAGDNGCKKHATGTLLLEEGQSEGRC